MPRTVVLGGTGFVGGHICATLAALGHRVVAVARRPGAGPAGIRFATVDTVAGGPAAIAALLLPPAMPRAASPVR